MPQQGLNCVATMTETILARLRVREMHGIRRFLYPVRARVDLPVALFVGEARPACRLTQDDGTVLPWQVMVTGGRMFLEFALSLAPWEQQTVTLAEGGAAFVLDDPLHVIQTPDGALHNQQKQFAVTVTSEGALADVVYERASHLRGPSRITRNGEAARAQSVSATAGPSLSLNAYLTARGFYKDGCGCYTQTGITAAKSWAKMTHTLDAPKPHDEVVFTLPFALTSHAPTCDFGVGGGIYGKLQAGAADSVVWRTEFGEGGVEWSVETNGRADCTGRVNTAEAYHAQQWFHVLDGGKALAVAVMQVPKSCRVLTVTLAVNGDVQIAFTLGSGVSGAAEFGVCWHFLNNVPAIAAATNPQSILLPPVVDVLPIH